MPLKLPALDPAAVPQHRSSSYPEPFRSRMGDRVKQRLGDACGLTRFGVNLVTLGPGGQSALRHWHTLEDEFVYVLEGEVVLVTNEGEQVLTAGMCAGYPGGRRDAHHMINRSAAPARYLEVGNRIEGDNAFYPDDDLMWIAREDGGDDAANGRPEPRRELFRQDHAANGRPEPRRQLFRQDHAANGRPEPRRAPFRTVAAHKDGRAY